MVFRKYIYHSYVRILHRDQSIILQKLMLIIWNLVTTALALQHILDQPKICFNHGEFVSGSNSVQVIARMKCSTSCISILEVITANSLVIVSKIGNNLALFSDRGFYREATFIYGRYSTFLTIFFRLT